MDTQKRLEELRTILRAENMSYDELHELQDLGARGLIEPDDVELLEAAGVPEGQKSATDTRKLTTRTVSHLRKDWEKHGRYHCTINALVPHGKGPDLFKAIGLDGENIAAELVKRWNAYPDLVATLERLLDAGTVDLDQACKDARILLATLNTH